MRALAVLLAVALVVTGINLPFSVGSLQAAAQENGTGEVQEQNQDEPDTQEPDTRDSAVTELTLQGSGTEEDPYKIASLENLENFQAYVNSGGDTQGKYFFLPTNTNIVVEETEEKAWTPIGTPEHPFLGTFRAGGNVKLTFRGAGIESFTGDYALFGENGGTIENLTLYQQYVVNIGIGSQYADRAAGIAIINRAGGKITGCYVGNNIIICAKNGAGGIAFENNGLIEDCEVGSKVGNTKIFSDMKESRALTPYGGIVGKNNAGGKISNCTNWGVVGISESNGGTTGRLGGIAGYNAGTIENCTNRGEVAAFALGDVKDEETGKWNKSGLGGIVGVQKSTGMLKDCFNAAPIDTVMYSFLGNEDNDWGTTDSVLASYYKQGCIVGQFEDASIDVDDNFDDYGIGLKIFPSCPDEVKEAQKTAFNNISGCSYWNLAFDQDPSGMKKKYIRKGVGLWSNPCYIENGKPEGTGYFRVDASSIVGYAPGITVKEDVLEEYYSVSKCKMPESVQGDGSAENPYQIQTSDDLLKYRDYVNKGGPAAYTKLMEDIEISSTDWKGIGTYIQPFFGVFDGNGKSITLNVTGKDVNTGLFGINCGTIKNLTVKGSLSGRNLVGAVAGTNGDCFETSGVSSSNRLFEYAKAYRGVIENCHNEAQVAGGLGVGGIAGLNSGSLNNNLYSAEEGLSEIRGCTNSGVIISRSGTGTVTPREAGGIAGSNSFGRITNSKNEAEISGSMEIGGIAGSIYEISDIAGGIVVGTNVDKIKGQIIQGCTSTGNVKFTGSQDSFDTAGIGAIAGAISYYGVAPSDDAIATIFRDCHYTMDEETNYKLPGVGYGEVKQYEGAITYTDNTMPETPAEPEQFKNGEGTKEDPYLIENLNNFLYFAQNHEKGTYYKLGADIDLKGNEKNPWTPIGSGEKLFEGILDGDGHTIRGLYVEKPMKGEE